MKIRSKLLSLAFLGFSISACGGQVANPQFCANGSMSIDESGSVKRAEFPDLRSGSSESDRTKLANAVVMGRPVWLEVMFEAGTPNGHPWLVSGVTTSNARAITEGDPIVISTFSAPKSIFVGPDQDVVSRIPSSEMVTVVVESTGRFFVNSLSPIQLISARWCID